jgi:primosomal protein N''
MSWDRKQKEKERQRKLRGERNWTRDEKDRIRDFVRKYEGRIADDFRKAG